MNYIPKHLEASLRWILYSVFSGALVPVSAYSGRLVALMTQPEGLLVCHPEMVVSV